MLSAVATVVLAPPRPRTQARTAAFFFFCKATHADLRVPLVGAVTKKRNSFVVWSVAALPSCPPLPEDGLPTHSPRSEVASGSVTRGVPTPRLVPLFSQSYPAFLRVLSYSVGESPKSGCAFVFEFVQAQQPTEDTCRNDFVLTVPQTSNPQVRFLRACWVDLYASKAGSSTAPPPSPLGDWARPLEIFQIGVALSRVASANS